MGWSGGVTALALCARVTCSPLCKLCSSLPRRKMWWQQPLRLALLLVLMLLRLYTHSWVKLARWPCC